MTVSPVAELYSEVEGLEQAAADAWSRLATNGSTSDLFEMLVVDGGRITNVTMREKAHQLLDKLPDSELEPVLEFIASRGGDSFARWLDSRPVEDEEITADEIAAIDEAHAELAAGEPTISHEEMKRELGFG